MHTVATKFGTIYIEDLHDREEEDRVKIFDSNQKYLDYYSIETIVYIAENKEITAIEVLQAEIENIKRCDDIESLVTMLTSECEMYTDDWTRVTKHLKIDSPTEIENDYVNKIGNYYIVVAE